MIKIILTDVDGVLTDGSINISGSGEVYKRFDVKDGFAITHSISNNIIVGIITGRKSEIVKYRAAELGVHEVFQGVKNKVEVAEQILKKYNFAWSEVAYIGDDIPDLELMKLVGVSGAPNDATKIVRENATYITKKNGGSGAFREFAEYIFDLNM